MYQNGQRRGNATVRLLVVPWQAECLAGYRPCQLVASIFWGAIVQVFTVYRRWIMPVAGICWCSWRVLSFSSLLFKAKPQFSLVNGQQGATYQEYESEKIYYSRRTGKPYYCYMIFFLLHDCGNTKLKVNRDKEHVTGTGLVHHTITLEMYGAFRFLEFSKHFFPPCGADPMANLEHLPKLLSFSVTLTKLLCCLFTMSRIDRPNCDRFRFVCRSARFQWIVPIPDRHAQNQRYSCRN